MTVMFNRGTTIFWMVYLLSIITLSNATVYSCNKSLSCGCSMNSATVTRIVGGEHASSGTWGWLVSISIAEKYLCGGSILSSSWVMTAAHCVTGYIPSQIVLYAGSIVRFSGTQSRRVSQIVIHSRYNSSTFLHDIALLKLTTPLIMSDPHVSVVCMPSVSSAILSTGEWPTANTTVVAVGWGKLNESGSLPSTLQQVTLQTVHHDAATCAGLIGGWRTQLCAGVLGGGKNVCYGDSGGPLMMFASSNQWVVIGLTSYGVGCAEAAYSAVYTRVVAYDKWINRTTNGLISTADSPNDTDPYALTTEDSESISKHSVPTTDPIDLTLSTPMIESRGNCISQSIFPLFGFLLMHCS